MLPVISRANIGYGLMRNIKFFRQSSMGIFTSNIKFPDTNNLVVNEFTHSVPLTDIGFPQSNFVIFIICSSSPPQIFKTIVSFITIFMTTLLSRWTYTDKCSQNKPMHQKIFRLSVVVKFYSAISAIHDRCLKYFALLISSFGKNSSQIRNAIIGKISDWFPVFSQVSVHVSIISQEVIT